MKLKRLAELEETSLAEVLRRAGEREVNAHPEIEQASKSWQPPEPRPVGIRQEVAVADWRMIANEPVLKEPGEKVRR